MIVAADTNSMPGAMKALDRVIAVKLAVASAAWQ
jgi:hypothetical protein